MALNVKERWDLLGGKKGLDDMLSCLNKVTETFRQRRMNGRNNGSTYRNAMRSTQHTTLMTPNIDDSGVLLSVLRDCTHLYSRAL